MKENNKLDSEKSNQLTPSRRNASGGFAFGKLLAGLVAAGVLGGGLRENEHEALALGAGFIAGRVNIWNG